MRQKFFIYKGKKYPSGAILKIKPTVGRTAYPYPVKFEEGTFVCYDTQTLHYFVKVGGTMNLLSEKGFLDLLVEPTDRINHEFLAKVAEESRWTFSRELAIEGMPLAWLWYIFLMGITLIFNGALVYWTIISVIFFTHRNKKLKEAGYKE